MLPKLIEYAEMPQLRRTCVWAYLHAYPYMLLAAPATLDDALERQKRGAIGVHPYPPAIAALYRTSEVIAAGEIFEDVPAGDTALPAETCWALLEALGEQMVCGDLELDFSDEAPHASQLLDWMPGFVPEFPAYAAATGRPQPWSVFLSTLLTAMPKLKPDVIDDVRLPA